MMSPEKYKLRQVTSDGSIETLNEQEPIIVWSRTHGWSNTPLQSVIWSTGQPCAYPD